MKARLREPGFLSLVGLLAVVALLSSLLLAVSALAQEQDVDGRMLSHPVNLQRVVSGGAGGNHLARPAAVTDSLARIDVLPAHLDMGLGGQQQFTATGFGELGTEIPLTVTWSADGGTVNDTGLYTATVEGHWTVTAADLDAMITGTATVTVTALRLARIEVLPDEVDVWLGRWQQFAATGYDSLDAEIPITPTWSAGGGNIGPSGMYLPMEAGDWSVTATDPDTSITGTALVHVLAPQLVRIEVSPKEIDLKLGTQHQFAASGYDELDNGMAIDPVWSADGGAVSATGLYTATLEGDWTVAATQAEVSGTATVRVRAPKLDWIEVNPYSASLAPGEQQAFTAMGFDDFGDEMVILAAWSSSGGPVGQDGLYTAGTLPGNYIVQALATDGAIVRQDQARVQIIGSPPPDLAPGESYCHHFPDAGWYPYYDDRHPENEATLIVEAAALVPPALAFEAGFDLAATEHISVTAVGFDPPSATIRSGDTVCWTNACTGVHAVRGGVYYHRAFLPLVLRNHPSSAPLPPREWDPRLDDLGVYVEGAQVGPGEPHWRLVKAQWADPQESAGRHTIFFEVLDDGGDRAVGQPVVVEWADDSFVLIIEDRPPPDWGANFAMYGTLGSYNAYVGGGQPSDRVVGMGMGTPEYPDYTVHTSFYLTYRWIP